jgi:hypothetical protein
MEWKHRMEYNLTTAMFVRVSDWINPSGNTPVLLVKVTKILPIPVATNTESEDPNSQVLCTSRTSTVSSI